MTLSPADFRSDTLTVPDAAMRQAMAEAPVGDDVWGEDPTVQELEAQAASYLGMAAALFVPSGTMANQVAIHVHCRPGDELICERRNHVFYYEGGAIARLSGTQVYALVADSGFPEPDAIRAAWRTDDVHYPRSRLLVLENTHNMAGGRVLDPSGVAARVAVARELDMAVHVDGARLANAAVACGCPASELLEGVDTVSLCLSKGLGAPVGSVLAGSAEFIAEARKVRKAFGGGMRQVGILAAAGAMALRDGPGRLHLDHERAARLGQELAELPGLQAREPETNILMVDVPQAAESLVQHLGERGVRAHPVNPDRVRFVTHKHIEDEHIDRCVAAARSWSGGAGRGE